MSSTEYTPDLRDVEFVLKEWLHAEEFSQFERYADFDAETIDLLVKEGVAFAQDVLAPTMVPCDREGAQLIDGRVILPEILKSMNQQAYELGWTMLNTSAEHGGQGAPRLVALAVKEHLLGAHTAITSLWGLSEGVIGLIESFGSEELQQRFIPPLVSGGALGTMCLSEPHAGSDVGANSTSAVATGDGRYKLKGSKCWISGGDQNLSENVIHTVLARIEGAPEGTKGLSLFAVPAIHVHDDGSLGERNDVSVASIEHKMGLNVSPTCVLNFGENDECYGYLIGEEHQGMSQMFQMMNEARLMTASVGLGAASVAYQNALSYAKERVQGSSISKAREANASRVAIIEHPDVRLNLLRMRACVEASRALLYGATQYWDYSQIPEAAEQHPDAEDLLQILTPMCKGWITEVALDVVRSGIQILGGVGYTKDFPMEQYYRDLRVAAIYEGTTGIQALDLVGRKMTMRNGALFMKLLGHFKSFADEHQSHPQLGELVQSWNKAQGRMAQSAMHFQEMMQERGMEGAVLYATPFLMLASAVTAGYFYLQQGVVAAEKLEALKAANDEGVEAQFYAAKLNTLDFYINGVLPSYEANAVIIQRKNYAPLDAQF